MFNVGPSEVIVIALVLLIAVGPEQLPGVIRRAGRVASQVRSMTEGLRSDFMAGMEEIERATDVKGWAEAPLSSTEAAAPLSSTEKDSGTDEATAEKAAGLAAAASNRTKPADDSINGSAEDATADADPADDGDAAEDPADEGSDDDDPATVDPLSAALVAEDADDEPSEPEKLPPNYSHVAAANAWPPKNGNGATTGEPDSAAEANGADTHKVDGTVDTGDGPEAADGTPVSDGERGDSA